MAIQPSSSIETVTHREAPALNDILPSIRKVARLCDNLFLLVARFQKEPGEEQDFTARATCGGQPIPLKVRGIPLLPDREDHPEDSNFLLWISIPCEIPCRMDRLEICRGQVAVPLNPSLFRPSSNGLQSLVLEHLAGRDKEERSTLMDFIASASESRSTHPVLLSQALLSTRESLRERFPRSQIASHLPRGLHVESLLRIDEYSFYVRGWLRDQDTPIQTFHAISPEGCRVELLSRLFSYSRPDVDEFYGVSGRRTGRAQGFIAFFELKAPSHLPDDWIFQMENKWGEALEANTSVCKLDRNTLRATILQDMVHDSSNQQRLLLNQTHLAISRLQQLHQESVEVRSVQNYGEPPLEPQTSIIIPLYGRIDFLELQFAQFFRDPEIHAADLIYVLDSPELARELGELAPQLFDLYRVPFRTLVLERNSGFSAANNVGAAIARGRLLLFMNSDVFPARIGWLEALRRYYDSTPGIGGLGPKLLYEDDSLQHAGIYFRRTTGSSLWENMHYFKGLHRELEAANVARQVPAVTGACLMVSRKLYREAGGFRGVYVQGDFEDTDFCLRMIQLGRQNWYLPEVELYHLEAQSYPSSLRQLCYGYNCWLHSHLWNDEIEGLMVETRDCDVQARRLAIRFRERKERLHDRR